MSESGPRPSADVFGRARAIFESALDWPPAGRGRLVREASGGDEALAVVVESMLAADAAPHALLDASLAILPAQLQPGDAVGTHLRVVALLGRGGMGEVYRAHDTTLGRDVALKILPWTIDAGSAAHRDRLARLTREAQVLASLNHPAIASIYGIEEWCPPSLADVPAIALVLELVEGPTLADRLAAGRIAVPDALAIARPIAEALEAAHARGVVHRDLKPSNVALGPDGAVKLLDFGLAKAMDAVPSGGHADASPAQAIGAAPELSTRGGTPAYMSPEQVRGLAADARGDIWAFGAVFYEMLAGRRAFAGDSAADCFHAILHDPIDWTSLPADTPAAVRALLVRCLDRDPRRRLRDIGEARILLDDPASAFVAGVAPARDLSPPPASTPYRGRRAAGLAAAALVGGALAIAGTRWTSAPAAGGGASRVTRFTLATDPASALIVDPQSRDVALTPDGRHVIYKGGTRAADGTQLFIRALDRLDETPLTPRGWPKAPFTSPDGRWVGFFEPGVGGPALKKVAITGGAVTTLCRLDGASRGAAWGGDESIVLATAAPATGLQRVPAGGGQPEVLTRPDPARGEFDHLFPQFLPGDRQVLFTVAARTGGVDASEIAVLDLATRTWKTVLRGGRQAHYLPSGHLVYAVGHALMAIAFDPDRLETRGSASQVASGLTTLPTGTSEFDVAAGGTLIYAVGGSVADTRRLVWVDRLGREEPIDALPARPYSVARLSPDGTRIALQIDDDARDLWVWDLARRTLTRVTTDPGLDENPVWSADGRDLIFTSQTDGASSTLFRRAADGSGAVERLTDDTGPQRASSLLPGGDAMLIDHSGQIVRLGIGSGHPRVVLRRVAEREQSGVVSPDGRWLASVGIDGGFAQVFVRPYPDVGAARVQVSPLGGSQPVWAPDSRDLFYLAADGRMMRVPIPAGDRLRPGAATAVFTKSYFAGNGLTAPRTYDIAPDGRRFLMIDGGDGGQPAAARMVVVLNWLDELGRAVPTR